MRIGKKLTNDSEIILKKMLLEKSRLELFCHFEHIGRYYSCWRLQEHRENLK